MYHNGLLLANTVLLKVTGNRTIFPRFQNSQRKSLISISAFKRAALCDGRNNRFLFDNFHWKKMKDLCREISHKALDAV